MAAANRDDQHRKLVAAVLQSRPKPELEKIISVGAAGLVNALCSKTQRTALAYAVDMNLPRVVEDLIDLNADVNTLMPTEPNTVLHMAILNDKYDGTEMTRLLLSKGADHSNIKTVIRRTDKFNVTINYWLEQASLYPNTNELRKKLKEFGLSKLPEIFFGVIGETRERLAANLLYRSIIGHCSRPKETGDNPLVLLLPGPPGHGKTFLARSLARSLVDKNDVAFITCSTLQDDADLFGSRLGGVGACPGSKNQHCADGKLISFLRPRQDRRTVVILDEFEKLKDLKSYLGWDQAKKMYQAFLEPWQNGSLTDQGCNAREAGHTIDCSRTIFICMTNHGQDRIVEFAAKNKERIYNRQFVEADFNWVFKELVEKQLKPVWESFLTSISEDLVALYRRFDAIIPFLPFTKQEQVVVADTELRVYFSSYRKTEVITLSGPKQQPDPEEQRALIKNLIVHHSEKVSKTLAKSYNEQEGASSLQRIVKRLHSDICNLKLSGELDKASFSPAFEGKQEAWMVVGEDDRLELSIIGPAVEEASPDFDQEASDEDVSAIVNNYTFSKMPNTSHPRFATTNNQSSNLFGTYSESISSSERLDKTHQNKSNPFYSDLPSAATTTPVAQDIRTGTGAQGVGSVPEPMSPNMEHNNAEADAEAGLKRVDRKEMGAQRERYILAGRLALQQDSIGTWSCGGDYSRPDSCSLNDHCLDVQPEPHAFTKERKLPKLAVAAASVLPRGQTELCASSINAGDAPSAVQSSSSCSALCCIM